MRAIQTISFKFNKWFIINSSTLIDLLLSNFPGTRAKLYQTGGCVKPKQMITKLSANAVWPRGILDMCGGMCVFRKSVCVSASVCACASLCFFYFLSCQCISTCILYKCARPVSLCLSLFVCFCLSLLRACLCVRMRACVCVCETTARPADSSAAYE